MFFIRNSQIFEETKQMKRNVGVKVLFGVISVCWLAGNPFAIAGAEDNSDANDITAKLERKIQMLEKRLNYLEQKESSAGISRGQLADEIEKRLAKLEEIANGWNNPKTFRAYWKSGLHLETLDKTVKLKIGGRIMNDWAWFADSDMKGIVGDLQDGTEFRRARLYVAGQIYDDIAFKAQYDFADGDTHLKDMWIGMKNVPIVGNVKVGHFVEPFGLEEITSSKYITFMERGLSDMFSPGRGTGFMIYNHALNKRMTWAVGVFKNHTDAHGRDTGDGDYAYTGRVTFLPWYQAEDKLLHIGVAYSHRTPDDKEIRFRERPESHLAPRFVDTGRFEAKSLDLIGLEAAWVYGPFSLQGEYVQAMVDSVNRGDCCFQGFYIYGSYFLTGEHRPYNRKTGVFGRVKPIHNYSNKPGGGKGAWEIAARYSYLDLDDKSVNGGRLQDITLGVNWYLNPNTRVMWNYVFADLADGGDADIFQMRVQIDF